MKKWLRRLIFGYRADSEGYLRHLRKLGMRIGEGTCVYDPRNVLIDETRPWLVEIGENVQIGRGVCILTHGYEWAVIKAVCGEVLGSAGKVTIGSNVFLGVNTVILKGVMVGDNVIVGAGSLVTKDIPPNCVAAGNPARVLMTLEEYREKRKAAQLAEAQELAAEFRTVYGHPPGERELSEFFWLFADGETKLPSCWQSKLDLTGNGAFSREVLRKNQKQFQNMEEFLKSL